MVDHKLIKQSVKLLKDWLEKQAYFKRKDYSDTFFEKLLVITKGSVERAKSRYERHCTLKTIWPQYFTPMDIDLLRKDFEDYNSVLLPEVTEEGCRVSLSRFNEHIILTPDLFTRFIKLVVNMCEYAIAHDYPHGFYIILDHRYINLLELVAFATRNFTPLQHCITILLDGYGMRVKGIHIVTPSKAADALVTFLKQLLTAKLSGRIHVHKDTDTLFAHVPKSILPRELGGDGPTLTEMQESFLQELCTKEHEEWMNEARRATIDESMKPKDYFEDSIGMPGSFRTLSVD
ncbi:alpha-tocopherol transfer protein-like [Leguminivora glycinivorella]|uniref:alpha-tocopherol transfer protein-like n=1 Tax=Leguminivora glycinivorella TaxID=1035111 RepID=UPI00200E4E54|nr:alpha-tocopherol transfer protein-like [Leguminivora glycinivorella]